MEINGAHWKIYHKALIPQEPPHVCTNLSKEKIQKLFSEHSILLIRWISDYGIDKEMPFWFISRSRPFSMESLSSKSRNKIRKGLKNCTIKKVSAEYIAEHGYNVYCKAFSRYTKPQGFNTLQGFREDKLSFAGKKEWEFWAVFHNEELIAFNQSYIKSGACVLSATKFDPDYLKLRPSEALHFFLTDYYLNQCNLDYITNGSRSVSHETSMESFLVNVLKYEKVYCRLHIVYRSWVGIIVSMLFPFRRYIPSLSLFSKVRSLLFQEELSRRSGYKYIQNV